MRLTVLIPLLSVLSWAVFLLYNPIRPVQRHQGNPVYETCSVGACARTHARMGNLVPTAACTARYECIQEKEEAWVLIIGDSNGRNLFEALVDFVFTFSGLPPASQMLLGLVSTVVYRAPRTVKHLGRRGVHGAQRHLVGFAPSRCPGMRTFISC